MDNKRLWVEKVGCLLGFIVLSTLSFMALVEKEITTGSPKSSLIIHSTGLNAVVLGFIFLAGSLACLGYLLKYIVFYKLYGIVAFSAWGVFAVWYWVSQM